MSGDRHLYCVALAAWLEGTGRFRPTAAVELDELRHALKERQPDVLVMAANSLTSQIKDIIESTATESEETSTVLLLDRIAQTDVQDALRMGVYGCMCPTAAPAVLTDAIHGAIEGRFTLGPRAMATLAREKRSLDHQLSGSEIRLLALVADGLDNTELARQLCVSESTLRRMSSRVVVKLGVSNRTQAAVYAARQGLI